jgi:hypothetical protein
VIYIDDVVASDDVRVDIYQEVSPGLEKLLLAFEAFDMRTDDRCTGV